MAENISLEKGNFPKARIRSLAVKAIKQYCAYHNEAPYRISDNALGELDKLLGQHLYEVVSDALALTRLAKRTTLYPKDVDMCAKLRKEKRG